MLRYLGAHEIERHAVELPGGIDFDKSEVPVDNGWIVARYGFYVG